MGPCQTCHTTELLQHVSVLNVVLDISVTLNWNAWTVSWKKLSGIFIFFFQIRLKDSNEYYQIIQNKSNTNTHRKSLPTLWTEFSFRFRVWVMAAQMSHHFRIERMVFHSLPSCTNTMTTMLADPVILIVLHVKLLHVINPLLKYSLYVSLSKLILKNIKNDSTK